MGTFFSKDKTKIQNEQRQHKNKVKPKPTIKEIIRYYEYIKGTKQIEDVDVILAIINNTDWDKTLVDDKMRVDDKMMVYDEKVPSAPPYNFLPVAVPIN